ncbi:MAG: flavin reductase family protein [Gammaproteobacteria bacterium]|nr:flavin reductase family protein [Gammaproteobacteria bacterium]
MFVDFEKLSSSQVYFTLTQTVVPRPIAWTLSRNADGGFNLAPFSYFNAVCSAPPMVMLSIGRKPDGSRKDTRRNIAERRDFTVHIVDSELLEEMNASSASLPEAESELSASNLEVVPFESFPVPRLERARVAFACTLQQMLELGDGAQGLALATVHGVYVDDRIVTTDSKGRFKLDVKALDPVARLGASEYALLGELRHLRRPG